MCRWLERWGWVAWSVLLIAALVAVAVVVAPLFALGLKPPGVQAAIQALDRAQVAARDKAEAIALSRAQARAHAALQAAADLATRRSREATEAARLRGDAAARDAAMDDLMAGRRPPHTGA
jgi:hypothetical protein